MKVNKKSEKNVYESVSFKETDGKENEALKMFPRFREKFSETFNIKRVRDAQANQGQTIQSAPAASRRNNTESILRRRYNAPIVEKNEKSDDKKDQNGQTDKKYRHGTPSFILSVNRKKIISMGIIAIAIVAVMAISATTNNKNANIPNAGNSDLENDIFRENSLFEKENAELDELLNDSTADEIANGLSDIEKDAENSSTTTASDAESFADELSYELDTFFEDLRNKNGIENDTSLSSFSADLGGI